jgi:hypothetical protein
MPSENPLIWEFGSQSGTWFALCFFAVLFGVLGWSVSREIRRRAPGATRSAYGIGVVLSLGPMLLLYASSLGGFYVAEVEGPVLRLRYLLPAARLEIPLTDIAAVESIPWYRGRWRLEVAVSGKRYESATSRRHAVSESAEGLKRVLAAASRGR